MFNFNFGDLGGGWNFPLKNNNDDGIFLTLFNFGIEDRRTNIGWELCPFTTYSWGGTDATTDGADFSLINFKLYWDVIYLDDFFYFGPFTSINYAFAGENFFWDKYIFTVGLQAGIRANLGKFNYNILSIETGYRLFDGESRYHIGAKIDLVPLFAIFIGFMGAWITSKSDSN
jgi:hypothetical protein